MILLLTTFVVAVGSALLPFINIELYLVGLEKTTDVHGAMGVFAAISAGAGQTIGKIIWYEIARRGVETDYVRKKIGTPKMLAALDKWRDRIEHRPWLAGLLMFVSASAGIPPLLALAVVAGAVRMPLWVFVPTVLVGRIIRFYAILVGVDVLF